MGDTGNTSIQGLNVERRLDIALNRRADILILTHVQPRTCFEARLWTDQTASINVTLQIIPVRNPYLASGRGR